MDKNIPNNPPYEFIEEEKFVSSLSNLQGNLDALNSDSATNKVVDANQEQEISANTATDAEQSAEIQAIKEQISAITVSGVTQEYVDTALSKKVDKVSGFSLIASGVAEELDLDSDNNIESQTGLVVHNYITCEDESGNTHNVGNELVSLSDEIASKQDKLEGSIKIVGDDMQFISNEGNIKIGTEGDFQGISLNEGELLLSGTHVTISGDDATINGVDFNTLENTSNKVSAITSASTDTEYPSAKAVYDAIGGKQGTNPIIIEFPSWEMTDDNKEIGLRGETIYEIQVSNESGNTFYTTIGAEETDTCDTYFEKLKTNLILLDGTVDNYTEASYVQKVTENVISITWHAHYYDEERDDNQGIDLRVADCVCFIDFENKEVNFALTQWADDEMHMIHPIQIAIDTQLEDFGTSAETLTLTLKKIDGLTQPESATTKEIKWENIASTEVINYIKQGYNVEFGVVDTVDGEKVFKVGQYDVYYDTTLKGKQWLILRWSNFDTLQAVVEDKAYYFGNSFSVVVFDESGVCKYNNSTHVPMQGGVYTYKEIQSTSGDAFVSVNIVKGGQSGYTLAVGANTKNIEKATAEDNGLATAYDVQTYVTKQLNNVVEITYQDLCTLVNASNLVAGQWYRITDYQCTTTGVGSKSANHQFDIIVFADSTSKLNCKAHAIQHSGDTYFANSDLTKWELWYDIKNDTNKYTWADATNGKGVIYRMIDEFGNDVPYDFKNIQFYRTYGYYSFCNTASTQTSSCAPCYTFSNALVSSSRTTTDLSLAKSNQIYGNVIKPFKEEGAMILNNICFFGTESHDNSFDSDCYHMTFENSCHNNKFGANCTQNIFGAYIIYNTFGNYFKANTLRYHYYYNTFGDYCSDILFGQDTGTLQSGCKNMRFGSNIQMIRFYNGGTVDLTEFNNRWTQNIVVNSGFNCHAETRKTIDIGEYIPSSVGEQEWQLTIASVDDLTVTI